MISGSIPHSLPMIRLMASAFAPQFSSLLVAASRPDSVPLGFSLGGPPISICTGSTGSIRISPDSRRGGSRFFRGGPCFYRDGHVFDIGALVRVLRRPLRHRQDHRHVRALLPAFLADLVFHLRGDFACSPFEGLLLLPGLQLLRFVHDLLQAAFSSGLVALVHAVKHGRDLDVRRIGQYFDQRPEEREQDQQAQHQLDVTLHGTARKDEIHEGGQQNHHNHFFQPTAQPGHLTPPSLPHHDGDVPRRKHDRDRQEKHQSDDGQRGKHVQHAFPDRFQACRDR